jgi:hypothetical protein
MRNAYNQPQNRREWRPASGLTVCDWSPTSNLHPLDLAEGFAELLKEGWSETEIAESFDRRRQTVMQLLRLARYPESAKSVIREHMEELTAYDLLNKFVAPRWKDEASLGEALKSHVE